MAYYTRVLPAGLLHLCDIDDECEFWYFGFAVPYEVLTARVCAHAEETGLGLSDASAHLDGKIHRQFANLGLTELMIDTFIPSDAKETLSKFTRSEACYVYAMIMITDRDEKYIDDRVDALEAAWEMLDKEFEGLCGGFRVPFPEWHWGGETTVFYHQLEVREEKKREEKRRKEKEREEKEREEKEREEKGREEKEQTSISVEALQCNDTAHPEQGQHTATPD